MTAKRSAAIAPRPSGRSEESFIAGVIQRAGEAAAEVAHRTVPIPAASLDVLSLDGGLSVYVRRKA